MSSSNGQRILPWSHADFREQTATQTLEASDDEISSFSEADEAISSFSEANEACAINSASGGGTNGASEINSASEGEANETSETNGDRFRGMALPLVLIALGKGKAKDDLLGNNFMGQRRTCGMN